ncbi:MAG: metallophosphoesterase [Clostridia bacterium]|nr:metallophosphoesterase [Clostridia bacterium]
MKKVLSVILSLCMVLPFAFAVTATENTDVLQFDENGEFVIMHLCDCQDGFPASETMLAFIRYTIAKYDPDIVVLGGDNTVGPKETKAQAIEELVTPFVESETYFAVTFGNHDNEQGVDKEQLLEYYQQFGGEYCLTIDIVPELFGVGTHNLPVLSSDGSKYAFNIWTFDSNTYVEGGGYDAVHEDQIEWYKQTAADLAAANGGEVVPAMAFQHIIVGEVFPAIFQTYPEALAVPDITKTVDGVTYSFTPQYDRITSGVVMEFPCPGEINYGQFDAFLAVGDVIATFSGHDHINSFTVPYKGIDIVNTPGATFNSYGDDSNRGCRILTINENDPENYKNELVSISDVILSGESEELNGTKDASMIKALFGKFVQIIIDVFCKVVGFIQGLA